MLLAYNYFPVITLPAKFNDDNLITKYSILDQIWCNFDNPHGQFSGIINFLLTDHLPIFYVFKSHNFQNKIEYFRKFNNDNLNTFRRMILNYDFSQYLNNHNLNQNFTAFYQILNEIYDKSFPVKKIKKKFNLINEPWVTNQLRKCIRKKYRLYNQLKRGLITRSSFKKYKYILQWVIKKIKYKYYNDKFKSYSGDAKKCWSEINNVLRRKVKTGINEIEDGDGCLVVGQQMVTYFNDYFSNIAHGLLSDRPPPTDINLLSNINSVTESCFMSPTNDFEVMDTLRTLPNKGNSFYDIKPNILMLIFDIIVPIITYFYNECIFAGIYPSVLKVARVVPIFKTGSKK